MIVSGHIQNYSPALCVRELVQLHERYADRTALSVIGTSYLGQPLYALRMGNPYADTRVLIQASMHGREWINTQLVMAQMEDYLSEEKYADLLKNACLLFIPMINPDGVRIAQEGADWIADKEARAFVQKLIDESGEHHDQWKSNGRGVDLNRNFDAQWHIAFDPRETAGPGYSAYRGECPASEPESKALLAITAEFDPTVTLSYHSRGEYVYWFFHQEGNDLIRDEKIALHLSDLSGYAVTRKEVVSVDSGGGYKDWCVEKLHIPAFTIENGADEWGIPVPIEHFDEIYKKAKEITAAAARMSIL